jgi:hypothetical protein
MEWLRSFISLPSQLLSYSYQLLPTMSTVEESTTQDSISTSMETTSTNDVLAIKQLLRDVVEDAHKIVLPWEIVDMIVDQAEFWAHTSVNARWEAGPHGRRGRLRAQGNSKKDNVFVIRSLPIGVIPEQIDYDTHLGIVDGFIKAAPNTTNHPEPTEAAKLQTKDLIQRWVEVNSIKTIKQPCRKIVFTIWSHDQGWGGAGSDQGTFRGSYTWFDVGHERIEAHDSASNSEDLRRFYLPPDPTKPEQNKEPISCILRTLTPPFNSENHLHHPFLHPTNHIIRNRTAQTEVQKHVITWSHTDNISPADDDAKFIDRCGRGPASGNGEFVRNLKVGDTVTVWARARFPGWENVIQYCQIDVYWAV